MLRCRWGGNHGARLAAFWALRRRYRELKVAREPMRMDKYARGTKRPTQSTIVAKVYVDGIS